MRATIAVTVPNQETVHMRKTLAQHRIYIFFFFIHEYIDDTFATQSQQLQEAAFDRSIRIVPSQEEKKRERKIGWSQLLPSNTREKKNLHVSQLKFN